MRKVCKCGKEWIIGDLAFSGLYECPECEAKRMQRKYGKLATPYPVGVTVTYSKGCYL